MTNLQPFTLSFDATSTSDSTILFIEKIDKHCTPSFLNEFSEAVGTGIEFEINKVEITGVNTYTGTIHLKGQFTGDYKQSLSDLERQLLETINHHWSAFTIQSFTLSTEN